MYRYRWNDMKNDLRPIVYTSKRRDVGLMESDDVSYRSPATLRNRHSGRQTGSQKIAVALVEGLGVLEN